MPDTRPFATRLFTNLMRAMTALLAVSALTVASVAWIRLSRPFDPPRLAPMPVAVDGVTTEVPTYPGAVTVLTYHDVSDRDTSTKTLSRRAFTEQMAALAALGYRTVPLATVRDLVRHRPVSLPPRPLLLTFDEGSLTTWTTVDPVLERYHFTAVAFLTTDRLVEPGTPSYFLSTRQVRQLRETGRWEFGSHTAGMDKLVPVPGDLGAPLTNRILTGAGAEDPAQWRSRVAADLARGQARLRELTGSSAFAFSYPFGDGGGSGNYPGVATELPALIEKAGLDLAFVGENAPTGHVDAVTESSPRWLLPRIGVRRTTSVEDLLQEIKASIPTPMPARLTDLRWTGDGAQCATTPDAVTVRATTHHYGTCAVHGVNTSRWLDYTLSTRIAGITPRSTAVIGLRDGEGASHYGRVEVVLGMTRMVVRQRVGTTTGQLGVVRLPGRPATAVTITVRAAALTVRVEGQPPVTVAFDRRLHEGGITLAQIGTGTTTLRFQTTTLTNLSKP
jgi:peptidoglycan/xylan/chitin deacetylase (PgdA/CDA1 family)